MKHITNKAADFRMIICIQRITLCFATVLMVSSCTKTGKDTGTQQAEMEAMQASANGYFYFTNCSNPDIKGKFVAGKLTGAKITLTFINSPGGAYPKFKSAVVNGIWLTTPAGTLAKGSGNITLQAHGTPVKPGSITIPVSILGSIPCDVPVTVLNAPPPPGNCGDPAQAPGSIGCVTFKYRGNNVTYYTVRARDGKIWLQHNLGSPQVAINKYDQASFGHYFQWGRWDDGHQRPAGPAINGSSALQNPAQIAPGNPNFIKGTTANTSWWGTGGNASNTWSGSAATPVNGKDPCKALGAGWHMPSSAEWTAVMNAEFISDANSAFESSLKLTESGYRSSGDGKLVPNFVGGYYWSSNAANDNAANNVFFDEAYNAFITQTERGYGINCRCVK